MSPNHQTKVSGIWEKIAPTGWENALPLRFIDDGVPTRAAVSGCLEDGRKLVDILMAVLFQDEIEHITSISGVAVWISAQRLFLYVLNMN